MFLSKLRDRLRTSNPSNILLVSFLVVIILGTALLSLPISRVKDIKIIDNLFTSVSATCVTGLLTMNVLNDLTIFGQIIVLVMIQIGGLGLMSFIAMMFKRANKLAYSERKFLKDSLNKYDDKDVSGYLNSIFVYTFVTEFVAFIIIATQLFDGSGFSLFQSLFLSVSSFCNAGIDNLSTSSLLNYQSNVVINLVVTAEIILGGIGFIVWDDIKENIRNWHNNKYSFKVFVSKLKVHTKIVLVMTFALLLSAGLFTFIVEFNNALKGMSLGDKILGSYFTAVTLRTAGFYTIDFSLLTRASKIIMCIYMLIGGSPGGTAGGFKTTAIFLLLYGIKTTLAGKNNMHLFNRHIHKANYIKATTIILLYFGFILLGILVLSFSESLDILDLLFEACSGLGTVGLTIGITTMLSDVGKIVIMLLMFIGRIGPITLLLSFAKLNDNKDLGIKYPTEEIIVG